MSTARNLSSGTFVVWQRYGDYERSPAESFRSTSERLAYTTVLYLAEHLYVPWLETRLIEAPW